MLYLLVHTWKKEDFKVVGRKVIEAMPRLPKGANPVSIFTNANQTGAWCFYETENTEELNKFWEKNVPEMHTTEVIPVMQFFPPGPELYKLIHVLSSM